MQILVLGGGGIGGVLASLLVEQGHHVAIVVRRPEIADALKRRGFVLRDENGQRAIRGEAEVFVDLPEQRRFDFIFLATQPNQVEEAARSAVGVLSERGAFVVLQNGLCEERVAKIAGEERVIGAVVSWGASAPEPGSYERTSAGGFVIGRLSGVDDPRLGELALLLEAVGPVEKTANLAGARWSKLAMNCAISSLGTIGGDRIGKLIKHRFVRRLALEVMTEAVQVARAARVPLEKVVGTLDLNWIALTDAERSAAGSPALVAKHSLLLAVGARYRKLRSSMLAAIERGREPPIDFLNGEIVEHGKKLGVPTPVNAVVVETIRDLAAKRRAFGLETLKEVFDRTRSS